MKRKNNLEITLTDEQAQFVEDATKEIHQRIGVIKLNIYEIGRVITEVKKKIGKGHYLDWVIRDLGISENTALNYMNVYRECMGIPELVDSFKRSILYDICKPSFDERLREHLQQGLPHVGPGSS